MKVARRVRRAARETEQQQCCRHAPGQPNWRHTRSGADNSVMILVDLTPAIDGTGPARLLDMRRGRSAKVLTEWLDERTEAFKARIKVVTMDGFAITAPLPGTNCPTRPR